MAQKVNALNVGWMKRKQGLPVRKEVVGIGLITVVAVLIVATVLALTSTAGPGISTGPVAGLEASSARWAALGATYTRDYDAIAAASSARWSAMGESYREAIQAGLEASSARWAALGATYTRD